MALTKVNGGGVGTLSSGLTLTSDDPTITMTDSSGTNDIATLQATSGALIVTARDGSADGEIIFKKTDGSATDETMRIDSSGNVGIGATSPSARLQIQQDHASYTYCDLVNSTNGGGAIFRQIVRNIANTGTTSVDFAKLIGSGLAINNNDTNSGNFTAFGVGGAERMRIDSNGFVLIGTTTNGGEGFSFGSTGFLTHHRASGAAQSMVGYKNGGNFVGEVRTSTTATSYITSSDYRLKENVTYDWDATTRLKQLKPARFNFIIDPDKTVDGFLAHEAAVACPESVSGTKDEVDDDGNPVMQG